MSEPWELTKQDCETIVTAADGLPVDYMIEAGVVAQRKLVEWIEANSHDLTDYMVNLDIVARKLGMIL